MSCSNVPENQMEAATNLSNDGLIACTAAALLSGGDSLFRHMVSEIAQHTVQLVNGDWGRLLGG